MADRENEKKYSAETKGYTDKIYEVRFMPVLERSEYQAGPEREGLIKLQGIMEEKDFEKYINNGLIRITQDGDRLMMISKSEMYRSMLMGKFWSSICEALVCTATGLFVAIIALIAYTYLSQQVSHYISSIEKLSSVYLAIAEGKEK